MTGVQTCALPIWRGLPQSEGAVVKDNNDSTGGAWYNVQQLDLADFELVQVVPGNGGKFATSAAAIGVRDPVTGATARVGDRSAPAVHLRSSRRARGRHRAHRGRGEDAHWCPECVGRFVDFHPDKNQSNEAIAAMQMA